MTTNYLPITGLPAGGVSPSVIVCGDPERADRIAARLADSVLLSHKREYRAHLGRYGDASITVCSHGIGAPGAAVAFEELIAAGARRIIRVGTCGGLQPDIQPGCLVVATAAVQNTGYGREVTPDGYPAVAALDLTYQLGKVVDETGPANGLTGRLVWSNDDQAFIGGTFVDTRRSSRNMVAVPYSKPLYFWSLNTRLFIWSTML